MPCRSKASGIEWRPRSPTTLFAYSPPVARTKRWRRRSTSVLAVLPTPLTFTSPPHPRSGWQKSWCRIFPVSRTHSPASTRTGRETTMATPMFRFDPVELPPEALALRAEVREFIKEQRQVMGFGQDGFNREFSRAMGRRGWIGMTWPKQYGGHERSAFERY